MPQTAAYGSAALPRHAHDEHPATGDEASVAFEALRARLFAAHARAAAAETRRHHLSAERSYAMHSQEQDVRRLEHQVAALEGRAREYSRALNEAAALVAEMDNRILEFERRLDVVQKLLSGSGPCVPEDSLDEVVNEARMAQDLDALRRYDPQTDLDVLKARLGQILSV